MQQEKKFRTPQKRGERKQKIIIANVAEMRERMVKKTSDCRGFTLAERQKIERLLKTTRKTIPEIAKELGCHPLKIYRELNLLGLKAKDTHLYNAIAANDTARQRKANAIEKRARALKHERVMDLEMRMEFERLLKTTRLPLAEIAKELGVSYGTLYYELSRNGLKRKTACQYSAQAAQEARYHRFD